MRSFRNDLASRGARASGLVLALALMVFALAAGTPARAAVDRIVAVVNGEVITLKQLDNRVGVMLKTPQGAKMGQAALRQKVLEALIDQELINQAAKAKGVFVTDSDVNAAIDAIKKENNLSDGQFQASLAHSGTSLEAFREDLRVELLRNRVLGAQVMSKIVVTDSEVRAFLRGEGPDLSAMPGGTGDTRPLRMIVLPLDPKNQAKAMAEARRIKAEIEGGLSFADAAKKYSKDPRSRDKGGDAGDGATVANLPPEMQAAFAKLGSGQPMEPAAAGNAVVILSALGDPPAAPGSAGSGSKDKKKGKDDPGEFTAEAKESARRQLERYKMQQRYLEWVKGLKKNAIIRITL